MASALLLLVEFRFLLRLDLGLGLHQRPGLAQLPDPLQAINRILGVHHTIHDRKAGWLPLIDLRRLDPSTSAGAGHWRIIAIDHSARADGHHLCARVGSWGGRVVSEIFSDLADQIGWHGLREVAHVFG